MVNQSVVSSMISENLLTSTWICKIVLSEILIAFCYPNVTWRRVLSGGKRSLSRGNKSSTMFIERFFSTTNEHSLISIFAALSQDPNNLLTGAMACCLVLQTSLCFLFFMCLHRAVFAQDSLQ